MSVCAETNNGVLPYITPELAYSFQNPFLGDPQFALPLNNAAWGGQPPAQAPTAVLVSDLTELLEPMFEELQENTDSIKGLVKGVNEIRDRLKSLERAARGHSGDEGDSDEPGVNGGSSNPKKRRRTTRTADPTKPQGDVLHHLQNVVRSVIYSGCQVRHMKELQPGLDDEELTKRVAEDPPEPWRPNFLKSVGDPSNDFWVNKILNTALNDKKTQDKVDAGTIPREFWTWECLKDDILKPMWSNAAKEVKKLDNPLAQARGEANAKRGKEKTRQARLLAARMQLALGTNGHTQFKYKIRGEMKTIPAELMVQEAMSDVVDDECDSDTVPEGVDIEDYRAGRRSFRFEGVPPFYRRKMWNKVFEAMDQQMMKKPSSQSVQPRYYATEENRGQRSAGKERARDIPVSVLHRCHLSKEWYGHLSDSQRNALKPSPNGWEVDEERNQGDATMNQL